MIFSALEPLPEAKMARRFFPNGFSDPFFSCGFVLYKIHGLIFIGLGLIFGDIGPFPAN